jgi:hypothetical protein
MYKKKGVLDGTCNSYIPLSSEASIFFGNEDTFECNTSVGGRLVQRIHQVPNFSTFLTASFCGPKDRFMPADAI